MTPRPPLLANAPDAHRPGLHRLYALRRGVEGRTRDLGAYTLGWAIWSGIFLRGGPEEQSRADLIFSAWDEAQSCIPKRKEDA